MSKARDLADLAKNANDRLDDVATSDGALSNRNILINGAMQISQRGTSATAVTGGYATVDRWKFYESSGGAITVERSTTAPAGFANSVKVACTTADTSVAAGEYCYFFQALEGHHLQQLEYGLSTAKDLTLSFWVRSNKTGTYCVVMEKHSNTRYHYVKEYTIDAADTWEKKEITISPTAGSTSFITASGGAINNQNTTSARIDFWLMSGTTYNGGTDDAWSSDTNDYTTSNQVNWMDSTSNNFYLTGVQLEVGDTATAFEHRSYGDELARCQRYYQVGSITGYVWAPNQSVHNAGSLERREGLPVQMRATPTNSYSFTDHDQCNDRGMGVSNRHASAYTQTRYSGQYCNGTWSYKLDAEL